LDVGSGFGGLYNYLVVSGIKDFSYLGIDIMPEMVDIARKKYPKARFELRDILKEDIGKFDYVFCIGALNVTMDNYGEYVRQMIMKMLSIARKGVALNFLSDRKYLQAGPYHFENPEELKEFIEKNTDAKAEIIQDERVKGESFLYIRKN
jgi:SAM-dependent methyltransferase